MENYRGHALREYKLLSGLGRYNFNLADVIVTNFHLPKSTLLMLVSAFAGRELILKTYETAVQEGYRFYSFGDAMMIL